MEKIEGLLEDVRGLIRANRYSEAEDVMNAVLKDQHGLPDMPLPQEARFCNVMAQVCRLTFQHARATVFSEMQLKALEKLGRTAEPDYYLALLDQCEAYAELRKPDVAHTYLRRALEMVRGTDMIQTEAYARHLILGSRIVALEGDWDEVLKTLTCAHQLVKKLGKERSMTAATLHSEMATCYKQAQNWSAAATSLSQALQILREKHGTMAHRDCVRTASNLGDVYARLGRYDLALAMAQAALDGHSQEHGDGDDVHVDLLKQIATEYGKRQTVIETAYRQCRGGCGRPTKERQWCSQDCVDSAWLKYRRDTVQCAKCGQLFATGTLGSDGQTRCKACCSLRIKFKF